MQQHVDGPTWGRQLGWQARATALWKRGVSAYWRRAIGYQQSAIGSKGIEWW